MLSLMFVLPLGLDSFAAAAALGAEGALSLRARLRIALLFTAFEGGMPLIGLAAGAMLAHAIGGVASYLAPAAIAGTGIWMVAHRDDDGSKTGRLAAARGLAVIGLGISVSVDELAIGFSLGLTRLAVAPLIIVIAIQSFLASQLGLYVGTRLSERFREMIEHLAAIALVALGLFLLIERLLHR
jgi:putative Mn2+ efflux pump MntP